jgi:hypothetical protein
VRANLDRRRLNNLQGVIVSYLCPYKLNSFL